MDRLAPFRFDGRGIVSFSGGRTSGLMLDRVLEAHDGRLPDDVKVCFENTGLEDETTLDFVAEFERRRGVVIRWLEYIRRPGPVTTNGRKIACHGWIEVSHRTASRRGEPFDHLLGVYADFRRVAKEKPPVLPNPVQRFCTGVLKQRVMHWFVKESLGWRGEYAVAVGLRADEPKRVRELTTAYKAIEPFAPLAAAGVTEADVLDHWRRQSFDLGLESHPTLGTYRGNCDFCHMKSNDKIRRLYAESPERAAWWADKERQTGMRFRKDRFSMIDLVEGRVSLDAVDGDANRGTCFC